jgi:pyruvate-formate lyase-activating enzyme
MRKPAINLYLATSTSCNVMCKTCPVGRKEPEPGGIMSLEMFQRIINKCVAEARVIGVQLYHYNEPLLLPQMADMVRICHENKLPVFLSSNLVIFKNVPAVLEQSPEILLISVSGWTQEIYERSHKNGDIEKVKQNMAEVARLRKPNTHVQVSWHRYRYNEHEMPLMEAYTKKLGFVFVPYATSLLPQDRAMRVWDTGVDDPAGGDVLLPVKEAKDLCYKRRHWDCLLQDQIVAVNGQGMLLNCSNRSDDANLRGSLFDTTIREFLKKRKIDAACTKCRSVGAHVYSLQAYTRAEWSPVRLAEVAYRRLGLAGRMPAFTAWAARTMYKINRPQEKETF